MAECVCTTVVPQAYPDLCRNSSSPKHSLCNGISCHHIIGAYPNRAINRHYFQYIKKKHHETKIPTPLNSTVVLKHFAFKNSTLHAVVLLADWLARESTLYDWTKRSLKVYDWRGSYLHIPFWVKLLYIAIFMSRRILK